MSVETKIKELLSMGWKPIKVDEFDGCGLYNFQDPIKQDNIPLDNAWSRHKARISRNPDFYKSKGK